MVHVVTYKIKLGSLAYLAILAMGLQQFGLRVGTTKVDISCVIFIIFLTLYAAKIGFDKKLYILVMFLNSFWVAISYIHLHVEFVRMLVSCVWLTALLFLFSVPKINFDFNKLKVCIELVLTYTLLIFAIQTFQGASRISRLGLFDEPSYLGLVIWSAAAGYLGSILYKKNKNELLKLLLLIIWGISTLSMHAAVIVLITAAYAMQNTIKMRELRLLYLIPIVVAIFWFFVIPNLDINHFLERLDFSNPSNLSLLSWLRGLDQAIYASKNSFLLGFGPGSTGQFDFPSIYTEMLELRRHGRLNLEDAYSGLFRLSIEIGIVAVSIITAVVLKIFFLNSHRGSNGASNQSMFILWFSFALFIGIMIKEPTYSRSYVFVSAFLLGQFCKSGYLKTPMN